MIPDNITKYLQDKMGVEQINSVPVSGGSINQAAKVETDGGIFFLKWKRDAPERFFEAEAKGLKKLREADSPLRVPKVYTCESDAGGYGNFILMEFIETGTGSDPSSFGAGLAALHNVTSEHFGLDEDNFIGSLPQSNRPHPEWSSFFIEERINTQLTMAVDSGKMDRQDVKNWQRLADRVDDMFPASDPSLLHGDLWGGNHLYDQNGKAVLIDPAVYFGHPEADLAFTKLFGGFQRSFYQGYESVKPLEPGFEERVPVYNLYPLLAHVNLFGGHYIRQCKTILSRY